MKYNKPEIVTMAEAVDGIKGQVIKTVLTPDNTDSTLNSATAYEADE